MKKTIDSTMLTMGMLDAFLSSPSISAGILAALDAAPAVEPAQVEQSEESGDLMWMTAKMRDRERNRIGKIVDGLEQIKQEKLAAINAADDEPAQSAAEPVTKRWDSLSSIGNRLHNISVEQHYAGNEKLSDELGEFASLLWIWERTRKPTVPPAIVEPAQAVPEGYRLQSIAELDAMNEWIYSNDDLTIAYMSGRNDQKAVDHYNKQKALDFVRWIAQLKTGGLIQARANDILRILEKWK